MAGGDRGARGGHGNARRNRLRTVATPGTTSLDVISAGRLPDRRSRPGRALRLVRSGPAALRGSPLASPVRLRWPLRARRTICPGQGHHNRLVHELRRPGSKLSTNFNLVWMQCGDNGRPGVLRPPADTDRSLGSLSRIRRHRWCRGTNGWGRSDARSGHRAWRPCVIKLADRHADEHAWDEFNQTRDVARAKGHAPSALI